MMTVYDLKVGQKGTINNIDGDKRLAKRLLALGCIANTEIETSNSEIFEKAKNMQETTALLPDYSITNNETIGTSISGIVGSVITLGVLCLIGFVIKQTRRKGSSINE